ncbi:MAG: transporter substrate-binding domain-containing protein [Bacteroidetes bacterium]|nr:transporter substrate-binding domain-containing protein [Bacteroidota bacterium]MBL6944173.1 transporter substrate-binding domain-containing protein [Bacteroidales bacterium]
MKTQIYFVQLIIILMLFPVLVVNSANKKLEVGFQVNPPFIIQKQNHYEGVCLELWNKIADSLNVDFSVKEYGLQELLIAIETGEVDIAISPITVTASRLKRFSFSQPFYITNLAFATKAKKDSAIMSVISNMFTFGFLKAVISLFLIILIFGFIVWLLERKHNSSHFHKGIQGVGDGIWWSAVTMTTVGYGDKAPKTPLGRIFSMIWMFTAVILISGLTASISSSLTVHNLKSEISSVDDLRNINIGSVPGTGTAEFLDHYKINYIDFNTVEEGMVALNEGSITAFVYDDAVLNYYLQVTKFDDVIKVIPSAYFKEYFSFASSDDDLLKKVNQVLIGIIESNEWENDLEKYHIEYRN